MTAPVGRSAAGMGVGSTAGNRKVLRFGDGSTVLGDPDLYLPSGLAAKFAPGSDLSNEIIAAFTVSVATAMTVAATKSAAQGKVR